MAKTGAPDYWRARYFTFNLALLILQKLRAAMVFALEGGEAPPITAIQNAQAPSEFLKTSIANPKP